MAIGLMEGKTTHSCFSINGKVRYLPRKTIGLYGSTGKVASVQCQMSVSGTARRPEWEDFQGRASMFHDGIAQYNRPNSVPELGRCGTNHYADAGPVFGADLQLFASWAGLICLIMGW